MELSAVVKPFDQLTTAELYSILWLRSEVFVVEQRCIFQDMDNKDQYCHHVMLVAGDELAAYARIVPPGISYPEMSIGRVITNPKFRGTGAGRELMKQAIEHCYQLIGPGTIHIGAQLYLKAFYGSFGFKETGEPYDEDGILHIEMLK